MQDMVHKCVQNIAKRSPWLDHRTKAGQISFDIPGRCGKICENKRQMIARRLQFGSCFIQYGPLAQQVEQLTLNQPVTGSSPVRLTTKLTGATDFDKIALKCHGHPPASSVSSLIAMATLSDRLRAYRVATRAEGRSEKTIRIMTQA